MVPFWQKPIFFIVCFIVLLVSIPLLFSYLSKHPISLTLKPANTFQSTAPITVKPGSCLILEEKYCSQAEVIDWTNSLGQKMKLIGFNLPAGVPLSMPIDGQVAKVKLPEDATDNGFFVQIFDPNNPNPVWYLFKGDMQFDNMFSVNMKKGEVFGRTQNTGIKYRGHQFIFYIIRGLGKDATNTEDEIRKVFPRAKF